ncbi:MAG: hypothetical protein EBU90_27470 [Proteobacteria bacterium]|nr:hypothetical protein [Pseudomonadota bacterium]
MKKQLLLGLLALFSATNMSAKWEQYAGMEFKNNSVVEKWKSQDQQAASIVDINCETFCINERKKSKTVYRTTKHNVDLEGGKLMCTCKGLK